VNFFGSHVNLVWYWQIRSTICICWKSLNFLV